VEEGPSNKMKTHVGATMSPVSAATKLNGLMIFLLVTTAPMVSFVNACDRHRMEDDARERRAKIVRERLMLDYSRKNPLEDKPASPPCLSAVSRSDKAAMEGAFYNWKRRRGGGGKEDRNLLEQQYRVPVQFVVFQPCQNVGAINEWWLDRLMDELNIGFRDTPFEFYVSNPPEHVVNAGYAQCKREKKFRKMYRVPRVDTLTVFLCDTYAKGAVGFTYPPTVTERRAHWDGVVLMNPTLFDDDEEEELLVSQVFIHEVRRKRSYNVGHLMSLGCSLPRIA